MISHKQLSIQTKGENDTLDITSDLEKLLCEAGLKDGLLTVFCPGSTGGLTTIEYESGAVKDLKTALERVAPRKGNYAHNTRWGDGNGFSHVRSSLLGPSIVIPVKSGKLTLGTWQQVIFIDFDNKPRSRNLVVQIMGEK